MTDRLTIIEFLRARLDEDERITRWVVDNNYANHSAHWTESSSGVVEVGDDDIITGDSALSRHIERWDPARVLAEVEAKQRIITLCEEWIEIGEIPPNATWSDEAAGAVVARDVLSLLALPYADQPDYDPAWAPQEATP